MSESLRDNLLQLYLENWEDALYRGGVRTCADLVKASAAGELPEELTPFARTKITALATTLAAGRGWRDMHRMFREQQRGGKQHVDGPDAQPPHWGLDLDDRLELLGCPVGVAAESERARACIGATLWKVNGAVVRTPGAAAVAMEGRREVVLHFRPKAAPGGDETDHHDETEGQLSVKPDGTIREGD
eukprot:gene29183-36970_t